MAMVDQRRCLNGSYACVQRLRHTKLVSYFPRPLPCTGLDDVEGMQVSGAINSHVRMRRYCFSVWNCYGGKREKGLQTWELNLLILSSKTYSCTLDSRNKVAQCISEALRLKPGLENLVRFLRHTTYVTVAQLHQVLSYYHTMYVLTTSTKNEILRRLSQPCSDMIAGRPR